MQFLAILLLSVLSAGLCYRPFSQLRSFRSVPLKLREDDDDMDLDDRIDARLEQMNRMSRGEGDLSSYQQQERTKRKKNANLIKNRGPMEFVNRALFAGIFVAGMGIGITIDSAINTNPKDLASRDAIDKNAPNPKVCATYGSSAMVLDQRVFVTFNPFNVYVTQADTKPGCVLRPANVVQQLQKERNLVSDEDMEACKNSFNTWAFIGDINEKPQVNCVYQSDDAQNEFLSDPKVGLGYDIYDKPASDEQKKAATKTFKRMTSKKPTPTVMEKAE